MGIRPAPSTFVSARNLQSFVVRRVGLCDERRPKKGLAWLTPGRCATQLATQQVTVTAEL